MGARDTARQLLLMARKDSKAMEALADPPAYEPETFGFHAHQAAEKALKAWLILHGVSYEPTHSLRYLIDLLQQSECDVSGLWDFLELGAFAVQYRYEAFEESEVELDVDQIRRRVWSLVDRVEKMLSEAEAPE